MPDQVEEEEKKKNLEERLLQRLEEFSANLHRAGVAEYVEFMRDPRRVLWANFLGGLARGVGSAVGFTVVAAVVVIILSHLARLNIPVLGRYIADVVRIVELELQFTPRP